MERRQGVGKGYTRNKQVSREEEAAKRPDETFLHGIVGVVPGMYEMIDKRLEELDWNWVTLANQIPCSRQHLNRLTFNETIPLDMFLRICALLQIEPKDVIKTTAIE